MAFNPKEGIKYQRLERIGDGEYEVKFTDLESKFKGGNPFVVNENGAVVLRVKMMNGDYRDYRYHKKVPGGLLLLWKESKLYIRYQ